MTMFAIYVVLTLCISSTVFGYPNADARQKRQAKGRESCMTSTGTGGECLPFQKCLIQSKRFQGRPTVCRWETIGPVVCCPIAVTDPETKGKTKALTCGLSKSSASRKKRQAPFDDDGDNGSTVEAFVVGGKDATLGKWPWMALIFLEEDIDRKVPICGASLISEQTVLTAAHCFLGRTNSKFVVRLGEHNLAESGGRNKPVEIKVKKVVPHSNFRYPSLYNDIAILHLESKAKLTNMIQLVCLPKGHETETFVDKNAVVTGWGHLEFGGNRADTLQELELPVIPNEQCQKKYETLHGSRINLPRGIINSMMCAGIENERKDSCQGDSGGPLVFQTEASNWIQIGIVSAGFECGAGIPGLYTRVTAYLDWIAENTI